jgi:hypothetical protein
MVDDYLLCTIINEEAVAQKGETNTYLAIDDTTLD